MTKSGIIFCICVAVLALVFMILALDFPQTSADGIPGPGYFPIIICSIILVLSLILSISYIRRKEIYFQSNQNERANFSKLIITGIAIILYSILFMFLPFILITIVFLIFLNRLYQRTWKFNIAFSIIFTLTAYFVFEKFLHVML